MTTIVLASASPRRQALLRLLGVEFTVVIADVDESALAGESPVVYVERVARAKAEAVIARVEAPAVIAADTTVDVDGEILGKPADDHDAARMLRLLSGREHLVHTGVVVWCSGEFHSATVTTKVHFAALNDADIAWYLALGEHRDKAGAYGMQGAGGAFVERIDGSPSNVIGMPLAETLALLRRCTLMY